MGKIEILSKRITDSFSTSLKKLDKGKIEDFIDEVNFILFDPTDWRDWEEFRIYSRCFNPDNFWLLFEKCLCKLFEFEVDSPRRLWILHGPDTVNVLNGLDKRQTRFVFLQLLSFFARFHPNNSEFSWWYEKGREQPKTLEMLMDPHWIPYTHFDEIKYRIDEHESNAERLKQALAEKSRVEQDVVEAAFLEDDNSERYLLTVLSQCRIEVDTLTKIVELEGHLISTKSEAKSKIDGLTTDQVALFFHYLFHHLGVELHATEKGELINVITGHSLQNARAFFSNINKPHHNKPRKYKENINEVKKIFSSLEKLKGRKEIVDLIDRETDDKL